MGRILKQQQQQEISQQFRMPVNNSDADTITAVSGTDAWDGVISYYNSGALTTDAGQLAGTAVVIKLKNNNILNAVGSMVGGNQDTSFAFGTGTILTTRVDFPYSIAESKATDTGVNLLNAITADFANGEFCIDHENGVIYGKKATNGTTDTASYKILSAATGGSSGPSSNVVVVSPSTILAGTTTVTTAGTPVALGASTAIKSVLIQAETGNTGVIYVGNASAQTIVLSAGDIYAIDIANLATVYIDSSVNGDGVNYNATA